MEIIRNRKPIRMRYTVGERMLLRKSSSQWALVTRAESLEPPHPAGTAPAKPIAQTAQIDRLPSPVHPSGETWLPFAQLGQVQQLERRACSLLSSV